MSAQRRSMQKQRRPCSNRFLRYTNSEREIYNEKEYNYYLRLLVWFRKLKIPSKVFITLNYSRNKDKTFSPDDYKPQYIDIENPLFLPLIIKLFKKTESLKIMEMLPSAEDALDFDDDKHTAEFLIQWYNGESYK